MTVPSELFAGEEAWPPGFRFHPTDEELVLYYLKRKICRKRLKLNIIAETDVYKWDPEELPGISILKTGDRQWFFFSPRDRKYPNGARSNRATRHGYWKATGKDRSVTCNTRTVGVKKTLVFYKGRAPSGERTDWVMHEYTLDEEELKRCQNVQEYYALYKVYKKSGPGPKNGEQYGAPFKEESWADDECTDFSSPVDRDISLKKPDEVSSVDNVRVDAQVDDIEEFVRRIADEPLFEQLEFDNYACTLSQVVGEEETQSTMADPSSGELVYVPEPIIAQHPGRQLCDVQASFDYTQSATSQLQFLEAPEVTSVPNIHEREPHVVQEEDFLEMDDLIGPEPSFPNNDNAVENLPFEEMDGLSEFDLYHDAAMFIRDMGPIDQETVAHPYMSILGNNMVNQFDYQMQPNPDVANQTSNQLWTHDQGTDVYASAETIQGSLSLPPSDVIYESANIPTEANQNQNGNEGGGAANDFTSALWAFVESIPTTPASASENAALMNRAFERVSSFSRVRMNVKNTNVVSGRNGVGAETTKRAGTSKGLFIIISLLGVLCAVLWALIGTMRLAGRCISS